MKNIYIAIIFAILAVIIYFIYRAYGVGAFDFFTSEDFDVVDSYKDSDKAYALMERVNLRIIKLLRYLKYKYCINIPGDQPCRPYTGSTLTSIGPDLGREIAARILRNYNFERIIENDPKTSNDTSYTIDKGEKMYFCIRNKVDGRLIDEDTVLFVALHEISHIGNSTWGHDKSFWRTFKFILREAEAAGIYTPVDYQKNPIVYCGLNVDYNPYYDGNL